MLRADIRDALKKYRKLLDEGQTPHIFWINEHVYVATEENPGEIYFHDGDHNVNERTIKNILSRRPDPVECIVLDHLYEYLKDRL